ncbi:MAG: hypothetical protein ICV87_05025 [Gemmatimonadetes bacterium]|nr:hypothetical protein [Gemmatimonadota bacterium]
MTLEITSLRDVDGDIVEYTVGPESRAAGKRVRDLALPDGVVLALVARGQEFIPPRGSTSVRAGDHVFVVLRSEARLLVNRIFSRSRDAEQDVPPVMEFPLRGSTTVAELEEFYGIRIDAPDSCTLDSLMRQHLGTERIAPGQRVAFGEIELSVRKVGDDGELEQAGLTILPAAEADDLRPDGTLEDSPAEGAPSGDEAIP